MAKYRDYWTIRFGEIDGKPSNYRPEKVRGLPTRLLSAPEWTQKYEFFAYKDKHGWHIVEVLSGGAVTKNWLSFDRARCEANLKLAEVREKRFLRGRQNLIAEYPLKAQHKEVTP